MSNIDLKVTIEEKYWHSQNFDFQGLRILTGKKHRQIKPQRLEKVGI